MMIDESLQFLEEKYCSTFTCSSVPHDHKKNLDFLHLNFVFAESFLFPPILYTHIIQFSLIGFLQFQSISWLLYTLPTTVPAWEKLGICLFIIPHSWVGSPLFVT